ncbi:ABC-F family ATP-binding cassette domain-containing protein [Marilutibacter chinensis]|uniref:ATP-binding cassette domain-containing protein n=1 Tax=Marilutibacter chinensis TaxID=2912247 RepID=A0ABS9HZX6_9GAMM|nr:ABC-F family ATP-binding cassette domain-containing protein [Lysobacter chinensis]MCF7223529.1 ATP-binding cassette domain-containing protein [Lysobacter chinensis]MCF7223745.1 ATP-binding cassette domain-containing protein [Lysobacter chinensis]
MSEARVSVSHLSFAWPDGTPVLTDVSCVIGPSRTGLVAPNGGGKSTLLRLIAGELSPGAGTITVSGDLGYLPQDPTLDPDARVADALGVASTVHALEAIACGDTDPALFERAEGHWDIRERIAATLARLGLDNVSLERRISTFSGGQAMSLALAGQLLRRPAVLLLDEPTNHLDLASRKRLLDALSDYRGSIIVASHDRTLLEGMEQIAELRPSSLRLYGGGFGAYQASVESERLALEHHVHHLRRELHREHREMRQARERTERRTANARRNRADAGLSRIVAGNRARAAEVSAAKTEGAHGHRVSRVREQLQHAKTRIHAVSAPSFSLPATRVADNQLLLAGEHLQADSGGRSLFGGQGVSLTIRGPERIAILGDNGTGKTTLLRILAGEVVPIAGRLRRGLTRSAYLSQRLGHLDPSLTVAENLALAATRMTAQGRSDLLARLQFRGARMHLPAGALSGGEHVRLSLACVLHADMAPNLLLLDEPTNNLDLESMAELEHALAGFEGALVVVSHDVPFLDAIGTTRKLLLSAEGLTDIT